MSRTPDDKQNRLSGLSQDVIAVGGRTAKSPAVAAPPARPATASGGSRAASAAPAPVVRTVTESKASPAGPVVAAPGRGMGVAVGVLGVLVMGVVIAGMQLFASNGSLREAVDAARINDQQLQEKLDIAQERIAKLEAQLGAAGEDAQQMGSASQASLLQVSAMTREMRKEIQRLSSAVNALGDEVADLRRLAEGNRKEAQNALVLAEKVNARVGAINQQVLAAGNKAATVAMPPEVKDQLKSLGDRTEKLTGDVRQLYRLVERR